MSSGEITVVEVAPVPVASVRGRVAWAELVPVLRARFDALWVFVRSRGLVGPETDEGHNACVYRDPDRDGVELEVAVVVARPFDAEGDVRPGELPSGRAARLVHVGDYAELGRSHDRLAAWCRGERSGPSWERYGHWDDDPARRLTFVYRGLP